MMGAGLLNTTISFKLVALKFCFPGSITSFRRFVYVFFLSSITLARWISGQEKLLTQQELH